MGKIWPLQDAKAKLSELIRAAEKAPQTITRHGEEAVVVLSAEEYRRLTGVAKPRTFYDIWKSAPKCPEFELPERRCEPMRDVGFD